ncbi:MAG: PorP/SprF family type IX secretion system membrane protein [Lewinellaceae bacterium]|nr:PorP/SprF family type IX secretion system membrane protein [Saprospiraceae bacterium]MCB9340711.1 PorP/SprF family type IX secretion system membrane protein [Lewinellaceae bacterium]
MKKLLLLITSLFILQAVHSQEQSAVFSHYHISPVLINPAYAGFNENHQLQMNLRSQWTGFPESPKTYMIGYNGAWGKMIGGGLNIMSEKLGSMSRIRGQFNFSLRFKLKDVKLSSGLSFETHRITVANSILDNPLYQQGDPIVEDAVDVGYNLVNAGLGFWAQIKEHTNVGLTFSNLITTNTGDSQSSVSDGSLKYAMLYLGHEFDIEEMNFKLQPSMLLQRTLGKPFQADFNVKGSFIDDKLIAGVSYRAGLGGAVGLLLGTNIDVFRLYYSYDVAFQGVQQYNGGTHEVTIAFDFKGGKKKFDRTPMNQ